MQKHFAGWLTTLTAGLASRGRRNFCAQLARSFSVLGLAGALFVPAAEALQLTVAWDNTSSGATGFKIERSTDGVSFAEIATVDVSTTSYVDSSLTVGSYSYRVRAFNDTSVSAYSNVAIYSTDSAPVITTQPASASVTVGAYVSFSVSATGSPTPTFQWLKNGVAVTGATASTFSISAAALTDAATYTVVVTNRAGSITSSGAVLTVTGIAPTITTQPVSQTVVSGGTVSFSVSASGTPSPTFQWTKNGTAITGATGSTFTIAGVSTSDAATYSVVATNSAGSATSQGAALTVTAPLVITSAVPTVSASAGRLANVSARAIPAQGAQTLSLTFTTVAANKNVLARGIGPGLATFTTAKTLVDPKIAVSNATTVIASNDNWGGTSVLTTLFAQVGAFPLATASKDAALVSTVAPASYSVALNGKTGGVAMLELYDADPAPAVGRFSKIVAQAPVGTGDGLLVSGFTVTGDSALHVLIRAIGPSLGVKGALADPLMVVYSGTTVVQRNDNWGGSAALSSLFAQVGASSLAAQSKDAVVDLTLQPGTYSVVVSGVNSTTGLAALEFYEVQ